MWRQLNSSEKAKLLGQSAMGGGMLALACALTYATFQLGSLWRTMPELLAQLDKTSDKLHPALQEAASVRKLIPPILDEVKAVRELVPPALEEVKAVREALPPIVNTSASSIKEASKAVLAVEPHITPVLAEVRKTREALPSIIAQADKVVGSASQAGNKAGQGAVQGVLTGIILSPFRLIGGAGMGLFSIMGLSEKSGLTTEDERYASAAMQTALDNAGKIGAIQSWRNPVSKNSGSVVLAKRDDRNGTPCYQVHHHVVFATKKTYDADIEMCRQADGGWAAVSPAVR